MYAEEYIGCWASMEEGWPNYNISVLFRSVLFFFYLGLKSIFLGLSGFWKCEYQIENNLWGYRKPQDKDG